MLFDNKLRKSAISSLVEMNKKLTKDFSLENSYARMWRVAKRFDVVLSFQKVHSF